MFKKKYRTESFYDLRFLASTLRLGKDENLKKLCEELEDLKQDSSLNSKDTLLCKTKFENYIIPKTKEFLAKNLILPNQTGDKFLEIVQKNHFFKIRKLLEVYKIYSKEKTFSTHQSFFSNSQKNTNELLTQIIKKGNLNEIKDFMETRIETNDKWVNAFHAAVLYEQISTIKWLLKRGAIGVTKSAETTLLNMATRLENIKIIALLLMYGFDVNGMSKNRITPLEIAIEQKNIKIIKLLLAYDAKVNLLGKETLKVLYLDSENNIKELIKNARTYYIKEDEDIRNLNEVKPSNQYRCIKYRS
ncbi:ankyrin repeat domain-containing protein [Rickettsiella massiliensis]|uniref:ankyrin repeat domain-containing protein n=1 Tax=Rickettsiella massiliensis TaxID=676517 RepID=UPI0004986551|nr:ankyrin repeat domain-containing protein [Rickettsiella massiliensis]